MWLEPCSGFLADAAVQSEVQKIILHKYGISQIHALSLQRLYMYVYDQKKSFCGIKDKVIMML